MGIFGAAGLFCLFLIPNLSDNVIGQWSDPNLLRVVYFSRSLVTAVKPQSNQAASPDFAPVCQRHWPKRYMHR